MATFMSQDEIKNLLECSLCLSTYKNPKCLPCVHTFCMECLQEYVAKSLSNDLACPLCRKIFIIPSNDAKNLPDHFFIRNMIEVEKKSQSYTTCEIITCDLCKDDEDTSGSMATGFCLDCNQNLCEICVRSHRRIKFTQSHNIKIFDENNGMASEAKIRQSSSCDKHKGNQLDAFCTECKTVACQKCVAHNHKGHNIEDLTKTSSTYRNQINSKISKLQEALQLTNLSINSMKTARQTIDLDSISNEGKIRERCNKIRNLVDNLEEELSTELRNNSQTSMKHITRKIKEAEHQSVQLENFIKLLVTMKENGGPCDIVLNGQKLLAGAENIFNSSCQMFSKEQKTTCAKFYPEIQEFILRSNVGNIVIEDLVISIGQKIKEDCLHEEVCINPVLVRTTEKKYQSHLDLINYNPIEFDLSPKQARFFVIKSYSEENVKESIKSRMWGSTEYGNKRLDQAFREREGKGPLYLFFSVNGSKRFCGMAQMKSAVDYYRQDLTVKINEWGGGVFDVKWIYVKDVPNSQLYHIRLENNEGKPVTYCRDTQEVLGEKGLQVLRIVHEYKHSSTILDCFKSDGPNEAFHIGDYNRSSNGNKNGQQSKHLNDQTWISDPHSQRLGFQSQHMQVADDVYQMPLTAAMLSAAPPLERRQMLGQRLLPLIANMYPDLARKITGMLLEIDNAQLLHMLQNKEALKVKVEEAVAVLQAYVAKGGCI